MSARTGLERIPRLAVIVMALAIGSTEPVAAAASRQFSDYPAAVTFTGRPARLELATAPEQWSAIGQIDKQIIAEGMAKGANFAGAFYLATVGCGSSCEAIFVIDLRTGQIRMAPEAASNGVLYQPDSRLIIIVENEMYDQPRSYLVFDDGQFKRLE